MFDQPSPPGAAANLPLNQITTRWSIVADPSRLVVRYAQAIRSYLEAILKDSHAADEVAQDFAVQVLGRAFDGASSERGRFRDYVKVAARNAALMYLRRTKRKGTPCALTRELEKIIADDSSEDPAATAGDDWMNHWRECLLGKVWRALQSHESRSPNSLAYTALRLSVDFPQADSAALAAKASEQAGRAIRADAFRQQLSRARRSFAQLLLDEVAATVHQPTPVRVEDELIALGLLGYVRDYLPADWREAKY